MKTMSRLFLTLTILSVICSVGDAQHSLGRSGEALDGVADPRALAHEPRLHYPLDDKRKEFMGNKGALSGLLTPLAQVWVVDTALVYSTTDTTRHRYASNAWGKMVTDLIERWSVNQWVNSWHYTFTYDANRHLLTELDEHWTNNQWVNYFRMSYTYDANGSTLTELDELWTGNQWENYFRMSYTYDVNGKLLTHLSEVWTNNQWENSLRMTHTYDANGRLMTELEEQWTNNQWLTYLRMTYTYDANGRMQTQLIERWLTQWVNSHRSTYTYYPNGRLREELLEQWVTSQWGNSFRWTYTYDTNENMATGQFERWQGGIWIPGNGGFAVTDSAGNSYFWFACNVMLSYRLITTDAALSNNETPTQYELAQNYPNPFNPTTKIQFTIVNRQSTIVRVYDVLGRDIATLVNEVKERGTYTIQWDASGVSSGVYFYRIKAGDFVQTKRMMVVR
jgi:hypothetical protein